ncbi:MAG TPA: nuclear transport factor 2 family protein [Flavitalea sp.]|nr:nuclear transport factor 2 family protein [Flavitalea sp.]
MSEKNKEILKRGNAAIAVGDSEGFLQFCADDTQWTFIGDQTLRGKDAVREWMAKTYVEPPKVTVANLIAEGDFLTAIGEVIMNDEDGKVAQYSYCDVWRFRDGKIVELTAFVIRTYCDRVLYGGCNNSNPDLKSGILPRA